MGKIVKSTSKVDFTNNIKAEKFRQTLQQLNYEIIDEIIMEEKGHIYEIVVAEYSTQLIELSSDELKFGPKLLNNKMNIL